MKIRKQKQLKLNQTVALCSIAGKTKRTEKKRKRKRNNSQSLSPVSQSFCGRFHQPIPQISRVFFLFSTFSRQSNDPRSRNPKTEKSFHRSQHPNKDRHHEHNGNTKPKNSSDYFPKTAHEHSIPISFISPLRVDFASYNSKFEVLFCNRTLSPPPTRPRSSKTRKNASQSNPNRRHQTQKPRVTSAGKKKKPTPISLTPVLPKLLPIKSNQKAPANHNYKDEGEGVWPEEEASGTSLKSKPWDCSIDTESRRAKTLGTRTTA